MSHSSKKGSLLSQSSDKSDEKGHDTKEKEGAVLRKRTISTSENLPKNGPNFKPGQSVLEQIGEPDHNGWMQKKGEHYNTWKTRYFVLKGPHLYYLKSNSNAVCFYKMNSIPH